MARPLVVLLCLWIALPLQAGDLFVRRVIDGDTLLLSDGQRVRLIGIDTPESHPSAKLNRDAGGSKIRAAAIRELGREATSVVKALVEGEPVRLEMDAVNAGHGHRDRYGRLLAYVYFEPAACEDLELWLADAVCDADAYEDGFLNALILESGFASTYTKVPFRYLAEFRALERRAREQKRGLWGPAPLDVRVPAPAYAAR